ncbi:hypothetical protein DSCO28_66250 [Desulfosarcina ovata subsp. sediminis]|uniref:Lipoprotein n=1 Tax=Desulfosarcina ovata subsp. sediminis TaxID=885957 RepID=A0A5K8A0J0_9BACT|nr:hypothetical protein [Desulfosarcina ovata]BBO86059.1 hypothetical protein DSCO28_66250 [Desulfosarcina ovata subsp. sediminis]
MRTVLAIFIAVFLTSVMGCGKYVPRSEVEENYLPKTEVKENYISKAEVKENYISKEEVEEDYIPKAEVDKNYVPKAALIKALKEGFGPQSTDQTSAAPKAAATDHTCRYWFMPGYYADVCLPVCPTSPYWQDLGVPCPQ